LEAEQGAMSDANRSAILRAEILDGESSEVTCALEMTETSVFIVTERLPPIGDTVHLRLSFPRAIRPVLVSVCVTQVRLSTGPGTPSGFVAEFEVESADAKNRVSELARRVRPASRGPKSEGQPDGADSSREREPIALTVLLVEDNQLLRDMFAYTARRYFSQRVGRVELKLAESNTEALRMIDGGGPLDVVIIDYFLGSEIGTSLITRLRGDARLRKTAIVAMSVGGADIKRTMLEAGADLFLHKPIVLKELFCTLEFLMDANRSDRGAA
jgi:CheY-like chemotaxis protein